MEKQLAYLVSNVDLEKKFKAYKNQIKIMVYTELNEIKNILDLLPESISACFILLRTSNNSGHWTSLSRNGGYIYYFDSYGVKPDGELSKISAGIKYQLHENTKALTRIIKTLPDGFKFAYNKIQFQDYSPTINTSGKWSYCFVKCIFDGLTLTDFQTRMTELKNKYHVPYDDLVCSLWKSL
jgi:DNA-binding ferritin-like protein (Dps family)